jgi:hypothetical protein
MCPVLNKLEDIDFEINIFRGLEHGVKVTACSEFLSGTGQITCGQECVHTPEARARHEMEVRKHQRELATIGPNVIG